MCNCFGDKKKREEEEDAYEETEDIEELTYIGDKKKNEQEDDTDTEKDDELALLEDRRDQVRPEREKENDKTSAERGPGPIPVLTVTDEDNKSTTSKKSKRAALKSAFKKIARPINRAFFKGVNESEQSPLVGEQTLVTTYDAPSTLTATHRSDSMDSFTSSGSAVSPANVEEFGDEVSPGRLQVSVEYIQRNWTLSIGVKQADCMVTTSKEKLYWQVHLALLPFKRHRYKTKYKSSSTPVFNQTFDVDGIAAQALSQLSIRFRVYGKEGAAGRKNLAGEVEIDLKGLKGGKEKITEWLTLRREGKY